MIRVPTGRYLTMLGFGRVHCWVLLSVPPGLWFACTCRVRMARNLSKRSRARVNWRSKRHFPVFVQVARGICRRRAGCGLGRWGRNPAKSRSVSMPQVRIRRQWAAAILWISRFSMVVSGFSSRCREVMGSVEARARFAVEDHGAGAEHAAFYVILKGRVRAEAAAQRI